MLGKGVGRGDASPPGEPRESARCSGCSPPSSPRPPCERASTRRECARRVLAYVYYRLLRDLVVLGTRGAPAAGKAALARSLPLRCCWFLLPPPLRLASGPLPSPRRRWRPGSWDYFACLRRGKDQGRGGLLFFCPGENTHRFHTRACSSQPCRCFFFISIPAFFFICPLFVWLFTTFLLAWFVRLARLLLRCFAYLVLLFFAPLPLASSTCPISNSRVLFLYLSLYLRVSLCTRASGLILYHFLVAVVLLALCSVYRVDTSYGFVVYLVPPLFLFPNRIASTLSHLPLSRGSVQL